MHAASYRMDLDLWAIPSRERSRQAPRGALHGEYPYNIPFPPVQAALLLRLQEPGGTFPKATKDFPGRAAEPLYM